MSEIFHIGSAGQWVGRDDAWSGQHVFDHRLAPVIVRMLRELQVKSVFDFGCGNGAYTTYFTEQGLPCKGFDGNPHTEEVTQGQCHVQLLNVPFDLGEQADAVLCLEVGEHVPAEYESILLDNLCNHAKSYMVLSWAVVGQDGCGHVNCQDNGHVIDRMKEHGFELMKPETDFLRRAEHCHCWYFQNSLMVFRRV